MSALSFTKLFRSILQSTLWVSQPHHVRVVWIAMLAMADRNGTVAASIPGLASEAHVTIPECEEALQVFLSPDKYSRTKDHDGRRIIEIDGGWQLINHAKYRAVQSSETERELARERMRSLRERRNKPSPSVTVTHVTVGDDCASASASPSESGSDLDLRGSEEGVTRLDPSRGRFAPEDFEAKDYHRVRCQELRFDIDALLRDFKLHEFNREYSDWDKRFSKWIEDEKIKRETANAKALSAPRGRGFGATPPLEPTAKHVAFAKAHGVEIGPIINGLLVEGVIEALGVHGAREELGKRLSVAARKAGAA